LRHLGVQTKRWWQRRCQGGRQRGPVWGWLQTVTGRRRPVLEALCIPPAVQDTLPTTHAWTGMDIAVVVHQPSGVLGAPPGKTVVSGFRLWWTSYSGLGGVVLAVHLQVQSPPCKSTSFITPLRDGLVFRSCLPTHPASCFVARSVAPVGGRLPRMSMYRSTSSRVRRHATSGAS
jgi:hypothetical protein